MCVVTAKTEKVGRRIYVVGNTYAIKEQLKDAGCKWDGDRKQWWIGSAKSDVIIAIVADLDGRDVKQTPEQIAELRCYGKAEYKGKTYYVVGQSEKTKKVRLTTLDCSIDFWINWSLIKVLKKYQPRERSYNYGRNTETVYQTVDNIRRFIEKSKANRSEKASDTAATKRCWECGCQFTQHDARSRGGDWRESYCGC